MGPLKRGGSIKADWGFVVEDVLQPFAEIPERRKTLQCFFYLLYCCSVQTMQDTFFYMLTITFYDFKRWHNNPVLWIGWVGDPSGWQQSQHNVDRLVENMLIGLRKFYPLFYSNGFTYYPTTATYYSQCDHILELSYPHHDHFCFRCSLPGKINIL